MKIICIGRNYSAHAKELKNELPEEPVIFMKPDTALTRDGQDFYLPAFSNDVHHEIELVLRISKPGKNISEKFAVRYFDQVCLGIDFTARDKQSYLKEKGLPWELAKAFDGSAVVGKLRPTESVNLTDCEFRLDNNGKTVQKGNTSQMLFSPAAIISFVSGFFTLRTGDLIFTGTPSGVAAVKAGNTLEGYFGNEAQPSLRVQVK